MNTYKDVIGNKPTIKGRTEMCNRAFTEIVQMKSIIPSKLL